MINLFESIDLKLRYRPVRWSHNRSGLSWWDQLMRPHQASLTVLAKEAVREAELARPLVRIPPAVPGKHLVVPGGLWGLCSVINELKWKLSRWLNPPSPAAAHLVSVVVSHDHVHHSLHEGLEHIAVEALDWLNERLERLSETALETKSWK